MTLRPKDPTWRIVQTAAPRRRAPAFTLVELLVVIGIIAVLISILLPSLNAARRTANETRCLSNVRQLCTALIMYSGENKGRFPTNIDQGLRPGTTLLIGGARYLWYDVDRIGRYLPKTFIEGTTDSVGGPVMFCPETQNTARSYAMNIWASSLTDQFRLNGSPQKRRYEGSTYLPDAQFIGTFFDSNAKGSSELILITERWADSASSAGLLARATVGHQGLTAGARFAGLPAEIILSDGRRVRTEIDYTQHRRRGQGTGTEPKGRISIGFADGHAATFSHDQLADPTTRKSRFAAKWSPYDVNIP